VLAWLMAIVECAEAFGAPGLTPDIAGAVEAATRDMSRAPSIAEMARSAGLSVSRFKAKFKEQLGMPPGEYVLRRRIDAARAMLERGETSVTEVAYALGFSSSQYFATAFKRFTRARPRDVSARGVARAGGGRVARGVRHRYAADAAGRDGRR
jgi:AraC-like DNA-binding protein